MLSPHMAEELQTPTEPIFIILPLSGRLNTFQNFMDNFVKIALSKETKHLRLTVVYFGEEGLSKARIILKRTMGSLPKQNYQIITLNETFSRGMLNYLHINNL